MADPHDLIPSETEIRMACDSVIAEELAASLRATLAAMDVGRTLDLVNEDLTRAALRALEVPDVERAFVTRFNTRIGGRFGKDRPPLNGHEKVGGA